MVMTMVKITPETDIETFGRQTVARLLGRPDTTHKGKHYDARRNHR